MPESATLNYFYGQQAEQYTFFRIPKILFTDPHYKGLSAESKILYGLMLDRMCLSMRNRWLDDQNRVYIVYPLVEVMDAIGCAEQKATKLLRELESGYGLIERKRRGLGKPNIIYVKNFVSSEQSLNLESSDSRPVNFTVTELPKSQCNKTYLNNTYMSDTDPSIYPRAAASQPQPPEPEEQRAVDMMDTIRSYREFIKENIEYDLIRKTDDPEMVDEILELMVDTVCSTKPTMRLNGQVYATETVKSRFLKLDSEHIRYVISSLLDNTTEVRNIRAYLLTALYNAPTTMSSYYTVKVGHDLHG